MINFKKSNFEFNYRAEAFVFDKSYKYILLHKKDGNNYWMLPGGRVELGETSQQAIIRELIEELNINTNVNLVMIIENFYTIDNIEHHELCFDFEAMLDYEVKAETSFTGQEGSYMIFKWVNIKNIDNYFMNIDSQKEYVRKRKIDGIVTHVNDNRR